MKLTASLAAAAVAAALTGLAGCDQQPDESRLGQAPSYSKDRTTPTAPGAPTASRSTGSLPEGAPSVGRQLDDAGITAKVKAALLASNDVEGSAINVDTDKGRVTLKGQVADKAQIARAIQIARRVEGVREVDNQLTAGTS